MKITVLDGYCLNTGDLSWDPLRAFGEVEVFDRTPADRIVERAAGSAIVLTNKTPLPAAVLDKLPDLRYIGVLATGYNVVDIEAARRKGIVVSNVPTYGTASVAQFVFALLLELCHHVQIHADAVRAGEWTSSPDWCFSKSRRSLSSKARTWASPATAESAGRPRASPKHSACACCGGTSRLVRIRWTSCSSNPTSSVSTCPFPPKRAR
jgi:lactate dehydrogenase-like 2-hydroxyacid dehydrogenase